MVGGAYRTALGFFFHFFSETNLDVVFRMIFNTAVCAQGRSAASFCVYSTLV